jgi:uncharacterized protein YegP (UPF0339 family)
VVDPAGAAARLSRPPAAHGDVVAPRLTLSRRAPDCRGPQCEGELPVAHKFEIYKDKAGEFRVRFKYNSETMFSTEGYSSKASAQNAIDSLKKNAPEAPVEDNS